MIFFFRFLAKDLGLPFYMIIFIFVFCFSMLSFISRRNAISIGALTGSWKNIIFAGLSVWGIFFIFDIFELSVYISCYFVFGPLYWILKISFLFWITALLFRNFIAIQAGSQPSWAAFPHMVFYLVISLLFTNYDAIAT